MARGGAAKEAANDIGRTELKTVVDNRTVGEILSEARIARDMDYTDVAEQLRIRRTYIEAIEEGRLGDLPGSTYAIGFVRTYAELLDLDVPKIVGKFKQEAADFEDRTQLVFPEPMPGSRGPTVSVILIAILMLAGAYGGWLYVSNKDSETLELVPPLPESLSKLLSQSTVGEPAVETAAPAPASEADQAPAAAPVISATTEQSPSVATAEPESTTPVPAISATAEQSATAAEQPTIVNETIASGEAGQATASVSEGEGAVGPVTQNAAENAAENTTDAATETASAASAPQAEQQQAEQSAPAVVEFAPITETAPAAESQATATQQRAVEATEPVQPAPEAVAETAAPAATQQAAAEETELPTVGGSQPASFGADSGASRIVIRATSPAWVEITAADGEVLLNRLLRTGDTFRVPDQPGIKLVTGSAGGLEFTVDGKVAPRIGAVGDVRRDVLLEPDALLQAQ